MTALRFTYRFPSRYQYIPALLAVSTSDVMSGKRARIGPAKSKKLVFVRANLKLVAKDYDARPFIAWDPDSVESDGFLGDEEEMGSSDSDDDVGFDV